MSSNNDTTFERKNELERSRRPSRVGRGVALMSALTLLVPGSIEANERQSPDRADAVTAARAADASIADPEDSAVQAAADVERQAEDLLHHQKLAKRRLALCQRSVRGSAADDYPENVQRALEGNDELGTFERVMEICQAYLTGKVDQLKLEKARMQGLTDE